MKNKCTSTFKANAIFGLLDSTIRKAVGILKVIMEQQTKRQNAFIGLMVLKMPNRPNLLNEVEADHMHTKACVECQKENERLRQIIEEKNKELAAYQAHDNLHYWLRRKAHDCNQRRPEPAPTSANGHG